MERQTGAPGAVDAVVSRVETCSDPSAGHPGRPAAPTYEPPQIELTYSTADLERESLYAGFS